MSSFDIQPQINHYSSSSSTRTRTSRFDPEYKKPDSYSSSSSSNKYNNGSSRDYHHRDSNRYKPYSSGNGYKQDKQLHYERTLHRYSHDTPFVDLNVFLDADSSLEKRLFTKGTSVINFDQTSNIDIKATGTRVPERINTFGDCNFHPIIKNSIDLCQYDKPTPVQMHAMPIILEKRDLMACAQTGSGKTAAFLVPILNAIYNTGEPIEAYKISNGIKKWFPVGLVLAPTRELALQIYDEAKKFTYRSNLRSFVVYGGADIRAQMRNLDSNGCHLLVATPGRLIDLYNKEIISFENIKYLILDEADRMLDMGFEPQIREIVQQKNMPNSRSRQTLMFSATFPKQIQLLAKDFLSDYIFLAVGRVGSTSANITQRFVWAGENDKHSCLLNILDTNPDSLILIFVETRRCCDELERYLQQKRFPAISIHGKKSQSERERALQLFKGGNKQILVATAVAARGLDISNVKIVVNFDLTNDIDDYVHRIGRTGRAGSCGESISFFNDKNRPLVNDLCTLLHDAQQEVPDFISKMLGSRGGYKRPYNNDRGKSFNGRSRHDYTDYRQSHNNDDAKKYKEDSSNGSYNQNAYGYAENGYSTSENAYTNGYSAAAQNSAYYGPTQAAASCITDPALATYLAYYLPQLPPPPPPPEL